MHAPASRGKRFFYGECFAEHSCPGMVVRSIDGEGADEPRNCVPKYALETCR
jgi:hypothetical protein